MTDVESIELVVEFMLSIKVQTNHSVIFIQIYFIELDKALYDR